IVWDDFVQHCVDSNLYGAENLSYIPGEVGASAVQNIGAYGVEVKDLIVKVEALDTFTSGMVTFTADECRYGYRDSLFKRPDLAGRYIITAVHYRLWHTPRYTLDYGPLKELREVTYLTPATVRNRVIEIRRSKLPEPSELGSAGSFFKNPVIDKSMWRHIQSSYPEAPHYDVDDNLVKVPAGWLIETSGLKGAVEGGAMVYQRQCLVIVNTGNATSDDVVKLYRRVQATVYNRFRIMLSPEVNVI
ncbi:UDP-N-acetylmuramate dehydrogenase, partial [uncultured Muribaculum sp.]